MTMPNPQNPNDAMYQFVNQQPLDAYPDSPDSSPSHFTVRQFTPTAITKTFPVVVTIPNNGFQNGESVRATKFVTYPSASNTGMQQLNNQSFMVQQCTTDTFELYYPNGLAVDGRNFNTYISGGQFTLTGPTLPVVNPTFFPPPGIPDPFV